MKADETKQQGITYVIIIISILIGLAFGMVLSSSALGQAFLKAFNLDDKSLGTGMCVPENQECYELCRNGKMMEEDYPNMVAI